MKKKTTFPRSCDDGECFNAMKSVDNMCVVNISGIWQTKNVFIVDHRKVFLFYKRNDHPGNFPSFFCVVRVMWTHCFWRIPVFCSSNHVWVPLKLGKPRSLVTEMHRMKRERSYFMPTCTRVKCRLIYIYISFLLHTYIYTPTQTHYDCIFLFSFCRYLIWICLINIWYLKIHATKNILTIISSWIFEKRGDVKR